MLNLGYFQFSINTPFISNIPCLLDIHVELFPLDPMSPWMSMVISVGRISKALPNASWQSCRSVSCARGRCATGLKPGPGYWFSLATRDAETVEGEHELSLEDYKLELGLINLSISCGGCFSACWWMEGAGRARRSCGCIWYIPYELWHYGEPRSHWIQFPNSLVYLGLLVCWWFAFCSWMFKWMFVVGFMLWFDVGSVGFMGSSEV